MNHYEDATPTRPPMTLGDMRKLGARGLDVACVNCRHQIRLDVDPVDNAF
jgi:hypothetical protein